MPGDSGVLVVTRVRSTTTKCTRGRGCNGHPAFPTPSLGGRFINGSGALRGEGVKVCLAVIASAAIEVGTLIAERPPPQNRTCGFPAYGSHLGWVTAKRILGHGWRVSGFGSQSLANCVICCQVVPSF